MKKLNLLIILRKRDMHVNIIINESITLFLFISFAGEKRTTVCGAGNKFCYEKAEEKLYGEDVIDGLQDRYAKSFREKCNCLPACTSITYDMKIEKSKYDWEFTINARNENRDKLLTYGQFFFHLFFIEYYFNCRKKKYCVHAMHNSVCP